MARTPAPARTKRDARLRRRAPVALACAVLFLASGCLRVPWHRNRPATDWSQVSIPRPQRADTPAPPAAEEPAPEFAAPLGPFVLLETEEPARPHVAAVAAASPVETPAIAPQLSAEESEAAQRQTRQSLYIADRNLSRTRGRSLSPMQADLVEKIQGFAREARAASREGDWIRARNLAEKAQILSQELIRSR